MQRTCSSCVPIQLFVSCSMSIPRLMAVCRSRSTPHVQQACGCCIPRARRFAPCRSTARWRWCDLLVSRPFACAAPVQLSLCVNPRFHVVSGPQHYGAGGGVDVMQHPLAQRVCSCCIYLADHLNCVRFSLLWRWRRYSGLTAVCMRSAHAAVEICAPEILQYVRCAVRWLS